MTRVCNNLKGQVFGKLTAEKYESRIFKRRDRKSGVRFCSGWYCRCECGKVKWICVNSLVRNMTKSCGCIAKRPGAAFRAIIQNYKSGAKSRGYDFLLTEEQCKVLFASDCFYCGAKPANVSKAAWVHGPEIFVYQGIDRKINEESYTDQNCVPCCYACNKAKGERDELPFIEHCKTIAARF